MSETAKSSHQRPLSSFEIGNLWRAERKVMRLCAAAVTILAAAFGLVHIAHLPDEVRYLVLLSSLVLLLAALIVQFAIRCPRCQSRLATQSLLMLPDRCKTCGVEITRPPRLDGELDV